MGRMAWIMSWTASLVLAVAAGAGSGSPDPAQPAPGVEAGGRDLPPAFVPFEYLIGRWNGQAIPKDHAAQRFRGWPESHSWAWIFRKGKLTGLSVAITGGKVLAAGKLTYDPARRRYRLEGTEPKPVGGSIAFEGALDDSGKLLVLDQVGPEGRSTARGGALRLALRPNSNFVRYTMRVDRRESGAVGFSPTIEVGLTKEGETFAAGSTAAQRPKCIVTGGAATMTLTYQSRTFPICCTGCRDEFHENPEKYLQKAALILQSQAGKKAGQPAPARVSRFEDAFAGDVVDTPVMKGKRPSTGPPQKDAKAGPGSGSLADETKTPSKAATKPDRAKSAPPQPSNRATGWLQIGQNLEKSGKSDAALGYYRRIVKEYPDTPAAETAKERIKAIENR